MFEYPTYVKSTFGNNCTVTVDDYSVTENDIAGKILSAIE